MLTEPTPAPRPPRADFMRDVVIIGAGAAGCFCSVLVKRAHPEWSVCVCEASGRPMAKLAVTGGGRCNITNSFEHIGKLSEAYPRGEKHMRAALAGFSQSDAFRWFQAEGIALHTQADGCVFPDSQDAMQVVRTLENLMRREGVELRLGHCLTRMTKEPDGTFELEFQQRSARSATAASSTRCARPGNSVKVLSAAGQAAAIHAPAGQAAAIEICSAANVVLCLGGTSASALQSILPPEQEVTQTVPSLFALKVGSPELCALTGTVVQNARLSLRGTGISAAGTLLITDFGLSGPATLYLSSYAARELAQASYQGTVEINWLCQDLEQTRATVRSIAAGAGKKSLAGDRPSSLTDRLWRHILWRAGAPEQAKWAETGRKTLESICAVLHHDSYPITGRARFKEEFVTCGGVSTRGIKPQTFESRRISGLYFAGEVIDIDGITGGFNLQAAWSTAFAVAQAL